MALIEFMIHHPKTKYLHHTYSQICTQLHVGIQKDRWSPSRTKI